MQEKLNGKRYPDISIEEHIRIINNSTSVQAMAKFSAGIRFSLPALIFKPCFIFLYSMFIKGMVLRFISGVISSALCAYEEFLTQLKLWEIHNTGKRY
mgnify:CR=1 FL=1